MVEFSDDDVPQLLNDLQNRGFIKIMNGSGSVVLRGKLEVKEINEDFITVYRNLFKGTKTGAMGTSITCSKNMKEFRSNYPQYSEEHILKATKQYINSCSSDNYKYLQQADYFIYKNQDFTRVNKTSRLLQWCEEIENNGEEIKVDFSKDA